MGEIRRTAGGDGATLKVAQRRINEFRSIQSHSKVANDLPQLKKMRAALDLASSISQIQQAEAAVSTKKKETKELKLDKIAPLAAAKLKGMDRTNIKLTIDEIQAVATKYYKTKLTKKRRPQPAAALVELMDKKPAALDPVTAISAQARSANLRQSQPRQPRR